MRKKEKTTLEKIRYFLRRVEERIPFLKKKRKEKECRGDIPPEERKG